MNASQASALLCVVYTHAHLHASPLVLFFVAGHGAAVANDTLQMMGKLQYVDVVQQPTVVPTKRRKGQEAVQEEEEDEKEKEPGGPFNIAFYISKCMYQYVSVCISMYQKVCISMYVLVCLNMYV
jgi:hypothetical protein